MKIKYFSSAALKESLSSAVAFPLFRLSRVRQSWCLWCRCLPGMRRLFGAGIATIYDPLTNAQFVCNGVANVICANRIDPAVAAILKMNYRPPFRTEKHPYLRARITGLRLRGLITSFPRITLGATTTSIRKMFYLVATRSFSTRAFQPCVSGSSGVYGCGLFRDHR